MYFWPAGKGNLSKSVKYKGAKVVYSQLGGGETVLLLHGFLEERGMWNDYANELSKTFNVVCIDLLGQGESDCLGYVHSMTDQAEAICTVLEAEGLNSFFIVGHSMGGYVALELARLYPKQIKGLVLFHSTAYPDSEERKLDRERVIELAQRNKEVYVKAVIPTLFAEHTRTSLKDEIAAISNVACGFTLQGIVANIRGMMERESRLDVLRDADFLKLIVHGSEDAVIPTPDIEEQAKLNNNIKLEVVEGIGHMGQLEAPERCLQPIKNFLLG